VADADVILAFWDGMTCRTLVNELGNEQSKTIKKLLNIATQPAYYKEAVRAAFILGNMGAAANGGRATLTKTTIKAARKGIKGGKKGQKW
jgi:hypothetical protein